ncbi:MAG: hypothetical protein ACRDNS_33640 [Trebonia sp.]
MSSEHDQPTPPPPQIDTAAQEQPRGRAGRRARRRAAGADSQNMLPQRQRRRNRLERLLMRLIATCGIVGIGVAISAIMISNGSEGWLTGLVVSVVSVFLAAILWSSRQL